MLQRASNVKVISRANRLLLMRDRIATELGPLYAETIRLYQPAIRDAARSCGGCTITAAERVLQQLGVAGNDIAVKRLVTCAAVELALAS